MVLQAFVLMKTSFIFIFRRPLEDALIKTNIFTLVIPLQKTSWSRPIYSCRSYVFKTSLRRFQDVFKMFCQDVLKTYSRRLRDIFKTSRQDVFKMPSNRLQNVFKTSCKDIFEMFSRRIIKLNCSC